MKQDLRILIVDDHAMVRLALSEAIQRSPRMSVVGEAENGHDAISLFRELTPHVVVMDFKLPDNDGDKVIAEIRAEFPDARIVLFSIFETSECIWRATEAGALGYVSKAAKVAEVISAIRSVAEGKSYYSEGLAQKLATRRRQPNLSPRELAVLERVVAGRSNKEIASELHMSVSSVKHHLESLFTKLEVNDRTQATSVAFQRGIVSWLPS